MCMFCRSQFVLLSFFFWPLCYTVSPVIYEFWLPLWYLQTLLALFNFFEKVLDFERNKRQTLPTRSEHLGSTTVFGEVCVVHLFNCLCCVVFLLRLLFICLRHVLCVLHAAIVSWLFLCFFITFIISSECNVYRVNSVYIAEGLNKTYFFLYNHMIMVLVDSLLISDDVCVV
jgi:hypothetical protein